MKKQFFISEAETGKRADWLCANLFTDYSRNQWSKIGEFWCDGIRCLPKTKTKLGQKWEVIYKENIDAQKQPWDYDLEILAQSKNWIAINKPAGMAVHPSVTDQQGQTVVNAALSMWGEDFAQWAHTVEPTLEGWRPGVVHRLDKLTSGVLLLAKTAETVRYWQEHWSEVGKIYWAVVSGETPKEGRIEAGIMRDVKHRQRMRVSDEQISKNAVTEFATLQANQDWSYLIVRPLTGRTHQIRVHLSSVGYPIRGDFLYGGSKADNLYLHARSLSFPDPDNVGQFCEVVAETPKYWLERDIFA